MRNGGSRIGAVGEVVAFDSERADMLGLHGVVPGDVGGHGSLDAAGQLMRIVRHAFQEDLSSELIGDIRIDDRGQFVAQLSVVGNQFLGGVADAIDEGETIFLVVHLVDEESQDTFGAEPNEACLGLGVDDLRGCVFGGICHGFTSREWVADRMLIESMPCTL